MSQESTNKPYHEYLKWLVDRNEEEKDDGRITCRQISKEYGKPTPKIKLWTTQIYDEIFRLNEKSPEFFQTEGIRVSIYFTYFDKFSGLDISLLCIPRQYEIVCFPFVQAKMGSELFYVEKIQHNFYPRHCVDIWLQGGLPNRYRDLLVNKADFYSRISIFDLLDKSPGEIDEIVRRRYKDYR